MEPLRVLLLGLGEEEVQHAIVERVQRLPWCAWPVPVKCPSTASGRPASSSAAHHSGVKMSSAPTVISVGCSIWLRRASVSWLVQAEHCAAKAFHRHGALHRVRLALAHLEEVAR